MPVSIHVVSRFVAKAGQEKALKAVLDASIAPARRELACYGYNLYVSQASPGDFCVLERWDGERALEDHLRSTHAQSMMRDVEQLIESPPDIRRYLQV